jgi:TolC family type I secretion outer membrane protein
MKNEMHDRRKQRHSFRLILLSISLVLLQAAISPSLSAMDLMEAYTRAKEHDPLFGSSIYEHEAARTLSKQGRSFLLPQVQASGSLSRYYFDTAPIYYLDYTATALGINLRQPIFDLRKFYEYRQYNIRETIGDVRFASAEQNLILRVAEAYFNGLAAGNLIELIDTEKKAVIEQLERSKRMFRAGVATLVDVNDAEARYDSVLSQEVEAKNNRDIKLQALKRIVGIEPGGLNVLKEEIPLSVPEPASLDGWIEKAKKHNPVLKSYAYQIDHHEAELKKNKGQHWPSVDLVAGYTKTNTNNYVKTEEISYGSVGIQLTIPIFSGGYISAKVSESQAILGQSRKEYENALSDATQKLGEAFLGIRGSIARIDALLTAVRSASASLYSNKMGLNAGIRTTVDVLNAQRELRDVSAKLLQARYDYLLNILKLKFFAGTLAADDVVMINQWLM